MHFHNSYTESWRAESAGVRAYKRAYPWLLLALILVCAFLAAHADAIDGVHP